jgi:hypothetical protein
MSEVKETKKRVNSKSKGANWENKVAKTLAENLPPLKFKRTQQSGAIVGGKNFQTTGQLFSVSALNLFVGDVMATNEDECDVRFRFVIECKAYRDEEKLSALLSGKSKIYEWLGEVDIDKVKVDKEGIVIFKFNNGKPYVAVNADVKLPVNFITLIDGCKVCLFEDLLKHRDWWLKKTFTKIA